MVFLPRQESEFFFFFTGKKSPVKKPRLSDVSLGDTGFGLLSQGADPCVRGIESKGSFREPPLAKAILTGMLANIRKILVIFSFP